MIETISEKDITLKFSNGKVSIWQLNTLAFCKFRVANEGIYDVEVAPVDKVILFYSTVEGHERESARKYLLILPAMMTKIHPYEWLKRTGFDNNDKVKFKKWIDKRTPHDPFTVVFVDVLQDSTTESSSSSSSESIEDFKL